MNKNPFAWASSLFRIFICGLAILAWYLGVFEPRSLFAIVASNTEGRWLLWLLCMASIIGIFDVAANDMRSENGPFEITRKHRHFGLCFMAFLYVTLIASSLSHVKSDGLTAYFLWNAVGLMVFVFIDAEQRSKDATVCSHVSR